jgi:hypothetical protein
MMKLGAISIIFVRLDNEISMIIFCVDVKVMGLDPVSHWCVCHYANDNWSLPGGPS